MFQKANSVAGWCCCTCAGSHYSILLLFFLILPPTKHHYYFPIPIACQPVTTTPSLTPILAPCLHYHMWETKTKNWNLMYSNITVHQPYPVLQFSSRTMISLPPKHWKKLKSLLKKNFNTLIICPANNKLFPLINVVLISTWLYRQKGFINITYIM